jgi:hypothetical protein
MAAYHAAPLPMPRKPTSQSKAWCNRAEYIMPSVDEESNAQVLPHHLHKQFFSALYMNQLCDS